MMRDKPRILFVLHLPPPVHGASMMGKYIQESELINGAFECTYVNLTTATSLEDIGKGGVRKLWRFAGLLRRIRKEVKRVHPDLVYITPNSCGGAFCKDYIVVQMLKRMGCRVVAHYHNQGVARYQHRWMYDKMYKRFFKELKVIMLAETLYADVQKYVKRGDVWVCGNGIPALIQDILTPALSLKGEGEEKFEEEAGERGKDKVVRMLFLSNLLVDKGVLVLLDALKTLKERGYCFVCDFVGGETADIDAARFAVEAESRELQDIAVYHGKRYGEEKEAHFRQADIFVLPTFIECFPLVLLEAMQHSLPCVATRVGGIPEILQEGTTGLICNARDTAGLASSLQWMLDHPGERLAMGRAGHERYMRLYTIDAFEQRLCQTLHDVLGAFEA